MEKIHQLICLTAQVSPPPCSGWVWVEERNL